MLARARQGAAWLGLAIVSLAVPGCADERGPDPFVTTPVTGRVRLGSAPLPRGWVEFIPMDGAVGTMQSSPIGPDGRFRIERAAVGTNGVGILGADLGRAQSRLFDSLFTPIRRTVQDGQTTPIDIDLLEETYLYQRTRERAAAR